MIKKFFSFFVICFFVTACLESKHVANSSSSGNSELPDDINQLQVMALQILETNCNSCHGPSSSGYGGINYMDDVDQMVDSGIIIPGNPEASTLYTETESGEMPLSGHIGPENTEILEQWILALDSSSDEEETGPAKTFTEINTNIIQPKCATCHNSGHTIPLHDYDAIMALVWINNHNASLLWESPSAGRMPSSGSPLSQQELDDIASWINAGALNN